MSPLYTGQAEATADNNLILFSNLWPQLTIAKKNSGFPSILALLTTLASSDVSWYYTNCVNGGGGVPVSTGMNVADGEQIMCFLTLDRDFDEKIAVMIINCKVYEGNEVLTKSTMIDSKIKEGCIIIIPVDYAEVQNHRCQHGTFVIIMHYTYHRKKIRVAWY